MNNFHSMGRYQMKSLYFQIVQMIIIRTKLQIIAEKKKMKEVKENWKI
ncbi:hypothetical protein [Bacillus sp. EAC]|nr:hypothetical protein [Bacillus sp. EAC]